MKTKKELYKELDKVDDLIEKKVYGTKIYKKFNEERKRINLELDKIYKEESKEEENKFVKYIIIGGILIIALLFTIHFLRYFYNSEQNYCEENPQDCECYLIGDKDFPGMCFTIWENGWSSTRCKGEKVPMGYCDPNIITESFENAPYLFKWQKKNPCQLFLEKKGWLDIDCVCSEWREKIKCLEWEKRENVNDTYYRNYGIPCIKKVQDNPDCIKAREKNECEKGNPEYIPNDWRKAHFPNLTDLDYNVYDIYENCYLDKTFKKTMYTCYLKNSCRKKTFEDLSCEELNSIKNDKYCEKYQLLFMCFSSWKDNTYSKDKTDILERRMDLGCFK